MAKVRSRVGSGVERFKSTLIGKPGPWMAKVQSTMGFAKTLMIASNCWKVSVARMRLVSTSSRSTLPMAMSIGQPTVPSGHCPPQKPH